MTADVTRRDAPTGPDPAGVRAFIAASTWRFAKTMPDAPHEYTLRRNAASDAAFEAAVVFIREHGDERAWGGRAYTYLDVDGWSYWTMGAPLDETILINRARVAPEVDVNVRFADDPDPARISRG
jgi:hypothetical protein